MKENFIKAIPCFKLRFRPVDVFDARRANLPHFGFEGIRASVSVTLAADAMAENCSAEKKERWLSMNALTLWNKELDRLHDSFSRLLERAGGRSRRDRNEFITMADWCPLVDIIEDDKEYLIKAELPEMKREDIKVTVENGVLVISGERKFEKEQKSKKLHRVEMSYGSFARSFAVTDDADPEKVQAEFRDGVLRVHIPKSESAKPKQIEVKAN